MVWNGASDADGIWTSYTPTLTGATTNPNVGATGSVSGWYLLTDKTVRLRWQVTFLGSGISAGSGSYFISIPAGLSPARSLNCPIGQGQARDSSVPTTTVRFVTWASSSLLQLVDASNAAVGSGTFPWASGDTFHGQCEFEIS